MIPTGNLGIDRWRSWDVDPVSGVLSRSGVELFPILDKDGRVVFNKKMRYRLIYLSPENKAMIECEEVTLI